jgi:hypothetical protein
MEYIITAIAIIILAAFFGFSKGHTETKKTLTKEKSAVIALSQSMKISEIKERLTELAKNPPPEKLSMGAMCYDMAFALPKNEYICPECGEKTLYTAEEGPRTSGSAVPVRRDIPECRRIIKQIKGLHIELDEKEFCAKCSPDLKDEPKLCLIVRYQDKEKPHRAERITSEDLVLVQELVSGKDKHKGEQGAETPLKDYLERLQKLLGIEIEVRGDK